MRINDAMARLFGLQHAEEAVGKTDFDFFGEEHARQAYIGEQAVMRTGTPIIDLEEKETWPTAASPGLRRPRFPNAMRTAP